MKDLEFIRDRAARCGLNLVAALAVTRYDAVVPEAARLGPIEPQARTVVVIGNGGGEFWRHYQRYLKLHPEHAARADPLDDYTRTLVNEELVAPLADRAIRARALFPFVQEPIAVSFMDLARLAGLGAPSLLGLLVHPTYGPWIAMRAALLIRLELDAAGPALNFDPCPQCTSRACIAACPTAAIGRDGWNARRCVDYRLMAACADACHARVACVLAPQARYSAEELAYHQEHSLRAIRAYRIS
ncbi:MAG TPA: hypothetical protein VKV28_09225 [Candidatus Binataceae bacterium]|nr:hypothetical protein [Candidatus Binataceae bacterium]